MVNKFVPFNFLFRLLADRHKLEQYLIDNGYADILGFTSPQSSPTPTPTTANKFTFGDDDAVPESVMNRSKMSLPSDMELPETERFVVELKKDANGLGITIAGYVAEKEELSGIFVKSVSAGSAADMSGKIQVNDRIIEVDNQSLQGFSNHQAVEVLKKSGAVVSLRLERYLRGPKFEQLQLAIAANELKPSTPSGSGVIFPPSTRSHSSSTQSIGAGDLPRRPSLTKGTTMSTSYTEAATVKLTDGSLAKEALDKSNMSVAKLSHARDSIETKVLKEDVKSEEKTTPVETSTEVGKPKYWIEPNLSKDIENTTINKWRSLIGTSANIIVAQIRKFSASSGLGISLEGTVDVEGGREVRPHHYIRSILPEGPVGQNALLRSGDELLGKLEDRAILLLSGSRNLSKYIY